MCDSSKCSSSMLSSSRQWRPPHTIMRRYCVSVLCYFDLVDNLHSHHSGVPPIDRITSDRGDFALDMNACLTTDCCSDFYGLCAHVSMSPNLRTTYILFASLCEHASLISMHWSRKNGSDLHMQAVSGQLSSIKAGREMFSYMMY